jgi:hypothetical protein
MIYPLEPNLNAEAGKTLSNEQLWGEEQNDVVVDQEPLMQVKCECGEVYTLHVHTVCPACARWPEPEWRMPEYD